MGTSDRIGRAVERAMREHRLDEWHRETVLGLVEDPPDPWPACCGNACDPCTLVLARVVRRARELMEEDELAGPGTRE